MVSSVTVLGQRYAIKEVRLHEIRVTHRTVWRLVEVETTDGLRGIGECSDTRSADSSKSHLAEAVRRMSGLELESESDDESLASSSDLMADEVFDRRLVIGALTTAMVDLAAQRVGLSLGHWLGGNESEQVPLYANINRAPVERQPSEFVETARNAVEQGFRQVKLAPFDGPPLSGNTVVESGLNLMRRMHDEVGHAATLLVDLHHRLSRDELEVAVRELEEMGVGWIEDAVSASQPDQLDWLASYTELPLAGGELLTSEKQFASVCEGGWLSYLLIDPKYVGGPLRYRKILDSVHDTIITHHNPTSPISTALCAQLATLTDDIGPLEFAFGEPVDRAALVKPAERLNGENLGVAPGPGLGIELVDPAQMFAPDHVSTLVWNP